MKGGSMASDAIVEAVNPDAWNDITNRFSNIVVGGSMKNSKGRKSFSDKVCMHCGSLLNNKKMNGGMNMNTLFTDVNRYLNGNSTQTPIDNKMETFRANDPIFKSEPAMLPADDVLHFANESIVDDVALPKQYSEMLEVSKSPAALKGGFKGKLKNINAYKSTNVKVFNNKLKGGHWDFFGTNSSSTDKGPYEIGLQTDSSIRTNNTVYGVEPNRVPNLDVLKLISTQQVPGPLEMNKTTQYGTVTNDTTNFSIRGGAKKTSTTARKLPKDKKPIKSGPKSVKQDKSQKKGVKSNTTKTTTKKNTTNNKLVSSSC